MARKQSLALVAHSGTKLGRGSRERREVLADAGHRRPIWYEVPKSSKASKAVRRAVKKRGEVDLRRGARLLRSRRQPAPSCRSTVDLTSRPRRNQISERDAASAHTGRDPSP
jgi:hypothetical protein